MFFYVIIIFTIFTKTLSVSSKSLYNAGENNELKVYPVKRKVANLEQPYFVAVHEEQPEVQYSDSSSNLDELYPTRYRRVELPSSDVLTNNLLGDYQGRSQVSLDKQLDLKRSSLKNLNKRTDRLNKRELSSSRRDDAFGVVYGNGRPIGILEPFPQAYEFSPLSNTKEKLEDLDSIPQLNPRRSAVSDVLYPGERLASSSPLSGNWENAGSIPQDSARYTDEKYPALLNDFKIETRLSNSNTKRNSKEPTKIKLENTRNTQTAKRAADITNKQNEPTEVKRNTVGITDGKITELKSALNRIQNPGSSDDVAEIEDNLRDILSDMGLVEGEEQMELFKNKRETESQDVSNKRETNKEDENLEEGANKIELVKAIHDTPNVDRNKREDKRVTVKDLDKVKGENVPDAPLSKLNNQEEADVNSESNEAKDSEDSTPLKSESNLKSNQETSEVVNENQDSPEVKRSTSGINVADYQSEGDAYIRSKRQESKLENNDLMKGLEKSGDLTVSGNKSPLACSGNDAEMEKKRNKDQTSTALPPSDKVKREQNELEYQKQIEQNIQAKIEAIKEEVKREIEALKAKTQRRKRESVNTLIEEETSALDPQEHPGEKLMAHVRRRRNLDSFQATKRTKRGLPDFSNLKNIDSEDYLDLTGEHPSQRNERSETLSDYQIDPQENKFLPENLQIGGESKEATEKRCSGNQVQEDLVDSETVNLRSNDQAASNARDASEKLEERSAAESSRVIESENNPQSPEVAENGSVKEPLNKNEEASVVQEENNNQAQGQDENNSSVEKGTVNGEGSGRKERDVNGATKSDIQNSLVQRTDQLTETDNAKRNVIPEELEKLNKRDSKELAESDASNLNEKQPEIKTNTGEEQEEVQNPKRRAQGALVESNNNKVGLENSNLETKLKDLEETKSELPHRRRRQVEAELMQNTQNLANMFARTKRASAVMPYAKSAFFPYRSEDDAGDDEGDEFDDDSFDERVNLQKRETGYSNPYSNQFRRSADYQNPQDYEVADVDDYSVSNNFPPPQKRSLANRYVANLNSDVYENPHNYLYNSAGYVRQKRQGNYDLAAVHSGGPMTLHHLAAARERALQQAEVDENSRSKRNFNKRGQAGNQNRKDEPENIADLSDTDLFGALPQSYDGSNLLRFKRVKKDVPMK